jgi:tripartite-type tricarboxylate transporter receptor subunit TctC
MITHIFRGLIVAATIALGTEALAQSKPTRLVVGFPPGGPIDAVARIMSEQLGRELGQVVVVENRAGANAGIAAEFVAKSTPDGTTLLISTAGAMTISPSLYEKLAADPFRDLAPVSLVVNTDEVLVTSANNPANNVIEFIAAARARKNAIAAGSSSASSSSVFLRLL